MSPVLQRRLRLREIKGPGKGTQLLSSYAGMYSQVCLLPRSDGREGDRGREEIQEQGDKERGG